MSRIGRNEPCPCGSGKKHKRCCWARHRRSSAQDPPGADAIAVALAWLDRHYREEALFAFAATVFLGFDEASILVLGNELPYPVADMLANNGRELVLAEGKLALAGGEVPCLDLVLGADGPFLDGVQREYLETLGRRSMSFYEVVESKPGTGLRVRDLLAEDEPVRWVEAPLVSQSLATAEGAVFAARLMPEIGAPNAGAAGERWWVSGGLYPQQKGMVPTLLSQVRADLEPGRSFTPRRIRSLFAVYGWLIPLSLTPPGEWEAATAGLLGPPN